MAVDASIRVLVVGASPDPLNANTALRSFVARGFAEFLAAGCVRSTALDYSVEEVRSFRPHLVLIFGSCCPDVSDYRGLRLAAQSVGAHLAFWLHDDPYEFDFAFKAKEVADTIFTNDRWALEHYCRDRVFHLPLAACPEAHYRPIHAEGEKSIDLCFVGVGYPNRIRMFRSLAPLLGRYRCCVRGSMWPEDLRWCLNVHIPAPELPDYYSRSLVVLNLGRDLDLANERFSLPATTPGPRTFEAALAGCVQLYFVSTMEIEEYFEPGKEILLFDRPEAEVPDIIQALQRDPDRALQIATASQNRALREHTYKERAARILATCLSIPVDALARQKQV